MGHTRRRRSLCVLSVAVAIATTALNVSGGERRCSAALLRGTCGIGKHTVMRRQYPAPEVESSDS